MVPEQEEVEQVTHYEVPAIFNESIIIALNARPEPGYTVPVAVGIPFWGAWGYGTTLLEAVENLAFTDLLYPTEEELAKAKVVYGAVKAAHPELTPTDPEWWEG